MINSREKGARAELAARNILRNYTGYGWERVPRSGALSPSHGLKGDLYIPNICNTYCIEVKHYKEDQISTKLITNSNNLFYTWWNQTIRESNQINKKPLLLFKHDRSKFFIANIEKRIDKLLCINIKDINIYLLEDWLSEIDKGVFICP